MQLLSASSLHTCYFDFSGSDKCNLESECLSFDKHMLAAFDEWESQLGRPYNATKPYVMFTTESSSLINDQKNYVTQRKQQSSPLEDEVRFATNIHDVAPNSGRGVKYAKDQVDPDTAMLAALITLKLQMVPRITIGNCCSGFHQLIHYFRNGGLGTLDTSPSLPTPIFRCLQEMENPHYRLCCWKKKSCLQQRATARAAWDLRHNITTVS
jgi:hypothetical protein